MNRLAAETSPYLRQHAHNPVDWYPWGDDAFAEARRRDVPVFLSVGYSACHWCHVMAHESFEDADVAAVLAAGFVSVKVDREERPDVDAVYMDAVQAVAGRGGWPMTVFMTPDGRPFFGGTYFPPRDHPGLPSFRTLLAAVSDAWRDQRSEVEGQADALADAVRRRSTLPDELLGATGAAGGRPDPAVLLDRALAQLDSQSDDRFGGFGPAPKFPQAGLLELCLRAHRRTGDGRALELATTTLDAMAAGGIYDHLGGGFARYSTDDTWTVPHFEKMLYDQAGLVRAYLHAHQSTGRRDLLQVVEETIAYVLRDLRSPSGGLYCAEDADSEGEEGRFYVWTRAELDAVLGDDGAAAAAWYGVDGAPNFEGRHILRRPLGAPIERPPHIERARHALEQTRRRRVRPGLDDKVLTEWNAMFCSALAEAAAAAGRTDWATAAVGIGEFLFDSLRAPEGRWLRSWQDGEARHLAYAADYAWVVDCATRLAELTGEQRWLARAAETALSMMALFRTGHGVLATTGSDAPALVVRPLELLDDATPSATAVAAAAVLRLAALLDDPGLRDAGEGLLDALAPLAAEHPLASAAAVCAMELGAGGVTEIVVTGDRPDLLAVARARYEPTAVLAWGEPGADALFAGRAPDMAYVCRHYTCSTPAGDPTALVQRLEAERAMTSPSRP